MGSRSPNPDALSLHAPTEPLADDMEDIEDTNPSDTLDDYALDAFTSEFLPPEATVSRPAILVVDDEPYVLRAIQRLLKSRDADVLTAPNGLQAIQMLKRNDQIAVVISDQFMPGMSGAELLEHIRQDYPDVVRVMLTGNNDLATAVEAINRGDVFRFVLKPWKNEELSRIVDMASEQYIVQNNHRRYQEFVRDQNNRLKLLNDELERRVQERTSALLSSREEITRLYNELQDSFDSTIQVLLSSMELGDIKIVDHCRRTAQRAQQLSLEVDLSEGTVKPLVRAGLLHWIGLVGAPTNMFAKDVEDFDVEEQAIWEFHNLLGQQVIQSVPALHRTGLIMLHYLRRYDDLEFRVGMDIGQGKIVDEELLLSCRILKICSFFERSRTIAQTRDKAGKLDDRQIMKRGIDTLKQGVGTRFDPNLVRRFSEMVETQLRSKRLERRLNSIIEIQPGMILAKPIETIQGIPIAPQDIVVTEELLRRFQLFHNTGGLGPIWVYDEM